MKAVLVAAAIAGSLLAGAGAASAAPAVTKLSQSTAASELRAAGITWSSSGNCTDRNNSHCTSFDQINASTVDGVITLRRASGCAINITGGTEVGHASGTYSHYNGYKVDVSHNSCIDGYIKRSFTYIGLRGDGYPQWKAPSGNLYCDEGNHWDITYF
jgi:hypothetical protein